MGLCAFAVFDILARRNTSGRQRKLRVLSHTKNFTLNIMFIIKVQRTKNDHQDYWCRDGGPSMNIITTFSLISGLSSINRFSMVRLSRPESVLEHTGMIAILCYLIRNQIEQQLKIDIPLGPLLAKALVHDWDELVTGDISRPTKYSSWEVRESLAKLELQGVHKIAELIDDKSLSINHQAAKQGDDGLIVAVSDLIAVVYKVWDEVIMQHNHLMVRQAINVGNYLIQLKEKLKNKESEIGNFLLDIVDQLAFINGEAMALDRPIHGCLREEIFQNGN